MFFYYTKVDGAEGSSVTITESHTGVAPDIMILKSQVVLYSTSCTKLAWDTLTVNPDGSATGTLPYTGSFIIGVKYDASSLRGNNTPSPQSIDYTFGTGPGGTTNSATIELNKK